MQSSRSDLLLHHLRSDTTDEDIALATTLLRRILSNVLEHPLEDKYRSINIHSKSWREQVAGLFCFTNEDPNDEEGGGRVNTTDDWLVCWCRDELLATVEQRPLLAVGGTSSATFQSFLVLGGAVLPLPSPPGSASASPSGGALLDALAHPSRQKLLAACEDALKAVEVLRSSTAAHRLVLRQKRERVGAASAEVKPDDSRHVDLAALVNSGGAAATPSEMRLVRNSIEEMVKLWISAQQTKRRQASPSNPVSLFEDNDVVCMPMSFVRGGNVAQLTSSSACAETPVQRPSHHQAPPCVAAFWKRVLTLADATCATSIRVDMGRLQELEDDMVNSASVAHISAAARAAVKERSRRDFKLSLEQMKPSVWPAELLHTATSLVLDIGSLMHQCTTLEQLNQPQHAHTTESTVESGDDDESSPMSNVPQDPRMQLTRRDRIEMRRLLDLFEENGDIEYLHVVKATWADTLVRLKRTYKTPTVYSAS